MALRENYEGIQNIFGRYWGAYGGVSSFIRSPYLHFTLLLTLVMYPEWSRPGWWRTVIGIMPNIFGFTMGGYAVWLAMGDTSFRKLLSGGKGESKSPFLALSASFVHFLIVQIVALFLALLAQAYGQDVKEFGWLGLVLSFFGYGCFMYALMTALAAIMAAYRYSTWYEEFLNRP